MSTLFLIFFLHFLFFCFSAARRPVSQARLLPLPQEAEAPVYRSHAPPYTDGMVFSSALPSQLFQSMRTRDTKKATELKNQVSGYAQEMVWNTGTIWMAMET